MNFISRKISPTPPNAAIKAFKKWPILISLCLLTATIVFGGIYMIFANLSLKDLVFSLGSELEHDYENRTNFLLLGTGVQGQNEASSLTDTIMIGSFDHSDGDITLLSIPRDLYIDHETFGGSRINQIYEVAKSKYDAETGILMLTQEIEKISGLNIHYYAKINFDGLKQIVNSLGGVEVNVENAIYDPLYPKDGTIGYSPFRISKGLQTLDGETALKYARSRKTTSDFDRAHRQQQLIFAIKEKAMKRDILTNTTKIKELFSAVSSNLETDLTIREIIELANLGQDISREKISSYVLHDDLTHCGGFLYTPDRDLYGGASVLLPISESKKNPYQFIRQFTSFILKKNKENGTKVQVLNGTRVSGLANEVTTRLDRYCFETIKPENAENKLEETLIQYTTETEPLEINQIKEIISGQIEQQTQTEPKIIIKLGSDYAQGNRDEFLRYIYTPPVKKENTTSTDTQESPTTISDESN